MWGWCITIHCLVLPGLSNRVRAWRIFRCTDCTLSTWRNAAYHKLQESMLLLKFPAVSRGAAGHSSQYVCHQAGLAGPISRPTELRISTAHRQVKALRNSQFTDLINIYISSILYRCVYTVYFFASSGGSSCLNCLQLAKHILTRYAEVRYF
jgi:hypothetical protein